MTKAERGARRFRLASPTTALLLGAFGIAAFVADVPLAQMTHVLRAKDFAGGLVFGLILVLGVVVARREPANPLGWIIAGVIVGLGVYDDAGRYSVLDYHFHHGALPFGPAAVSCGHEPLDRVLPGPPARNPAVP